MGNRNSGSPTNDVNENVEENCDLDGAKQESHTQVLDNHNLCGRIREDSSRKRLHFLFHIKEGCSIDAAAEFARSVKKVPILGESPVAVPPNANNTSAVVQKTDCS